MKLLSKSLVFLFATFIFFSCKKEETTPVIVRDEPIPYVSVTTTGSIIDDPKVSATIKISLGDSSMFSDHIGIELRGASSQALYEKKSYGFEIWDAGNEGVARSILGMPAEEDWVLHGPYGDKTLIKNATAYKLANSLNRYAARTVFVELEINGDYKGLYVMMEKIKRDKNRVDIKKLEPSDADETKITGGYIIKLDKTAGGGNLSDGDYTAQNSFPSLYDPNGDKTGNVSTHFLYDYPKAENITPLQSEYIKQYMHDFEDALASDQFKDEVAGYRKYIDVPSFIDFFLLNEVMQNHDGYRLSTFMSKDRGGKLKMGPIWDFDLGFGSEAFCSTVSGNYWVFQYNYKCPGDFWLVPFWWKRLLEDKQFYDQVKARWTELRASQFSDASLMSLIDDETAYLTKTGVVKRNFARWNILSKPVLPNSFFGTYDEEIDRMKKWTVQRTAWIDAHINEL